MKKSIMKRWIKALRSGKYTQGKGKLNRNVNFCCLGVLCDISKQDQWVPSLHSDSKSYGIEKPVK